MPCSSPSLDSETFVNPNCCLMTLNGCSTLARMLAFRATAPMQTEAVSDLPKGDIGRRGAGRFGEKNRGEGFVPLCVIGSTHCTPYDDYRFRRRSRSSSHGVRWRVTRARTGESEARRRGSFVADLLLRWRSPSERSAATRTATKRLNFDAFTGDTSPISRSRYPRRSLQRSPLHTTRPDRTGIPPGIGRSVRSPCRRPSDP